MMRYAKRCEKTEQGRARGKGTLLGSQCHRSYPLKGTASFGGRTGAGTLLSALWASGKALLNGL